jgi:hypothetical protein
MSQPNARLESEAAVNGQEIIVVGSQIQVGAMSARDAETEKLLDETWGNRSDAVGIHQSKSGLQ